MSSTSTSSGTGYGTRPGESAPPPNRQRTVAVIVISVILAVILVIAGIVLVTRASNSGGASGAASDFLADLQSGNNTAAYSLVCDETKVGMNEEQFQQGIAELRTKYGDIQDFEVVSEDTVRGVSHVTYNITTSKNAEPLTMTMTTQETNAQWQVCDIDTGGQS